MTKSISILLEIKPNTLEYLRAFSLLLQDGCTISKKGRGGVTHVTTISLVTCLLSFFLFWLANKVSHTKSMNYLFIISTIWKEQNSAEAVRKWMPCFSMIVWFIYTCIIYLWESGNMYVYDIYNIRL